VELKIKRRTCHCVFLSFSQNHQLSDMHSPSLNDSMARKSAFRRSRHFLHLQLPARAELVTVRTSPWDPAHPSSPFFLASSFPPRCQVVRTYGGSSSLENTVPPIGPLTELHMGGWIMLASCAMSAQGPSGKRAGWLGESPGWPLLWMQKCASVGLRVPITWLKCLPGVRGNTAASCVLAQIEKHQ
jgi:hypothetical protein